MLPKGGTEQIIIFLFVNSVENTKEKGGEK